MLYASFSDLVQVQGEHEVARKINLYFIFLTSSYPVEFTLCIIVTHFENT